MAWSRLVAAVALAIAAWGSAIGTALAEGTWPASVQLATSAALPGDAVSFSGQGPAAVGSGTCLVVFNGAVRSGADCVWDKGGAISGVFDVPADALTGTTAAVSVCWPGCYDDSLDDVNPDYWQANTSLKIVAPSIEVPNVTCLRVGDATTRLKEAGFDVVVDHEMGDVVTDQEPRPGAQLQQTTPVVLMLHGVLVPDLVGNTYDEARVILEARCLAISAVDGNTDGAVEQQNPGVGVLVPGGTTVNVTTSGSTPPTTTPPPPPPTPPTPVTNGPGPEPDGGPVSFPVTETAPAVAILVALLLVATLAAGALARAIRRYRGMAWVTAHVTVTPRPGPGATFEVHPCDERSDDHVITVVALEVTRSTTVEESPA